MKARSLVIATLIIFARGMLAQTMLDLDEQYEQEFAELSSEQKLYALIPIDNREQFSLLQCMQMAMHKNEQVLIAKEQIAVQQGITRRTLANLLPQLSVAGELFRTQLIGRQVPPATDGSVGWLTLTAPVFDASSILSTINSYASIRQARASLNASEHDTLMQVGRAFYQAYLQSRLVKVTQSQLERARAEEQSMARRVDAGHSASLDLQRAKLVTVRAVERLQRDQVAYKLALGNLGFLIHQKTEFDLAAPSLLTEIEQQASVEEFEQRAEKNRPDLKVRRIAFEIAHRARLTGWLQFFPRLELASDLRGPFGGFASDVSLQLRIPLYDGGARYGVIRETAARRQQELLLLRQKERGTVLEVRGALTDIELKKQFLTTEKSALELAQAVLKSSKNLYQVGHATSLDLMTAETQLSRAENDFEKATLNLEVSRLNMIYTLGELPRVFDLH